MGAPSQPWKTPRLVTGNPVASITVRQADVLAGICHGHTNAEIARRLRVVENTVKSHVKPLLRALGARDRAHAAALAASGQLTVRVRDTTTRRAA